MGAAAAVVVWIGANLLLHRLAGWSFDNPAFPWLQGAGELAAIFITTLILMSQRRKDELSELREQLTLELVIMIEQKDAKLIALIEEMRRDNPLLVNRVDVEAEAMSKAADPEAVLEASHGNTRRHDGRGPERRPGDRSGCLKFQLCVRWNARAGGTWSARRRQPRAHRGQQHVVGPVDDVVERGGLGEHGVRPGQNLVAGRHLRQADVGQSLARAVLGAA